MIRLKSCPKKYTADLDKAVSPEETLDRIKKLLQKTGLKILKETKRIDVNRLKIPVFMSIVDSDAKNIMPTRKQMGKGSSELQAEVSAVMELVERFSFFYFWKNPRNFMGLSWSEAESYFRSKLIPFTEITKSTDEEISYGEFKKVMDLVKWKFAPALVVGEESRTVYLPADWFKKLNEFNGSSAGNTFEESILQGGCELIERHVCAIIDKENPTLPTLDINSFKDPTLTRLCECFKRENIKLWLKDFSLNMGVPTVGALAYDPKTFPKSSEIVFTAGTASSPEKAAIRALTEVAQLGGDFCTNSNYEASGLSKYKDLKDCRWIQKGPVVSVTQLPDISHFDIYKEVLNLSNELKKRGYTLYSIDISHPLLKIPCNYNIVPGFRFRERTPNASLGMLVGRTIAEELPPKLAEEKIKILKEVYKNAYFINFYEGVVKLRKQETRKALNLFKAAADSCNYGEEKGLILFYIGYALSLEENWSEAIDYVNEAINLDPENYSFYNLKGVCLFKQKAFFEAAKSFKKAIELNKGSAIDYANLGICYKFLNQFTLAKEHLEIALSLEPDLSIAKEHLKDLKIQTYDS